MKAIEFEKYGPPEVLQLKEVAKPAPKDNEVLVKIHATSVTKYDCWVRSCTAPPGFGLVMRIASGRKPKKPILGTELAGKIEAVGKDVTRLQVGDRVYAYPGMNLGAYAEYICLPAEAVAIKPTNTTDAEAATVLQGALTAEYFLRQANIQRGDKVLIFGASGGVGGYAVQLAKHHYGAEVTGVCSTQKLEEVKSLGADHVIDYTRQDFTQNGEVYEVIFDTAGKTSVWRTKKSLKEKGSYLIATFGVPMLIQMLWLSITSRKKLIFGTLAEKNEDLVLLKELIEAGVIRPVVDQCYTLEQAAEAHRYVESGQKRGGVALIVDQFPDAQLTL